MKRPRLTVSLDEDLMRMSKKYAKEHGYRSVQDLISISLSRFIRRNIPKKER